MEFKVGPTGNLLKGHLYDVNKYSLERALKAYDSQLYLYWEPTKRKGLGCWEVRRRPDLKTAIPVGDEFYLLDYIENPLIHHVLDVPFLNYQVLDRIKHMDAWNDKNWVDTFEEKETKEKERLRAVYRNDLRYALRDIRKPMARFKQLINEGLNPALIAKYWK